MTLWPVSSFLRKNPANKGEHIGFWGCSLNCAWGRCFVRTHTLSWCQVYMLPCCHQGVLLLSLRCLQLSCCCPLAVLVSLCPLLVLLVSSSCSPNNFLVRVLSGVQFGSCCPHYLSIFLLLSSCRPCLVLCLFSAVLLGGEKVTFMIFYVYIPLFIHAR